MKTRVIIFRVLMFLYLCAVALLCFCKFSSLPEVQATFLGIPTDKIVHFCMFLPFPILAFFCFDSLTRKPWQSMLWVCITFIVGCALAALTEYIQGMLPYRSLDRFDFLADAIGMAVGCLVAFIIDISKMKRDEIA